MKREILDRILEARRADQPVVLATRLDTGAQQLLRPSDPNETASSEQLHQGALQALAVDRSKTVEVGDADYFLQVFNPPVHVILVGAVHIAQSLSRMTLAAGYRVVLVDPREAFATQERFPGVDLVRAWPEEAFASLRLDRRSAVVTLSHDPKFDDPALSRALRSPAFYIGALGSRRTHAKRCARLEEAGFSQSDLDRIHAPVGLALGARSPGEIAASVVAQMIGCLRAESS